MENKDNGVLLTDETGHILFADDGFLRIGNVTGVHMHIFDLMEEFNALVTGSDLMQWVAGILAGSGDYQSRHILLSSMRVCRLSARKYSGSGSSINSGAGKAYGRNNGLWIWELAPVWYADKNRLPQWVNTAPTGIWIVTMQTWKLLYMNDYAVNLYGYPRTYWYHPGSLRARWEAQIHYSDRKKLSRMADRFLSSDTTEGVSRHKISDPAGNVRTVEERYLKITDAGNRPGELICSVMDVSGQVAYTARLENLLQKREEINRLRTNLIRLLAHEFRTPLTVLQNSSEQIKKALESRSVDDELSGVITKNSGRIQRQMTLMNRILKNVSMHGTNQTGSAEIQVSEFDLIQLVTDLAGDIGVSHGRTIAVEVPGEPLIMEADSNAVKIILSNLLTNACKYSQGAKEPRIAAVADKPSNSVRIEVEDFGIGIPEEEKDQIFEYFFRSSNARNTDGFGVGLSIAREMVVLHNGYITVSNNEDEGTLFVVVLPRKQPAN